MNGANAMRAFGGAQLILLARCRGNSGVDCIRRSEEGNEGAKGKSAGFH